MRRHFDPVNLRIFVAICEEGSLARAAERECVVASAVSKRLAALESELALPLIDRSKRSLEPTPAGYFLLQQAREILGAMEKAHLQLAEFVERLGGNVRGVATRSALAEKLPDDVAGFLTKHPHVNVRIDELLNSDVPACVREGRADFGICWVDSELAGLQIFPYRGDHLCAVVPTGHELSQRERVAFVDTLRWPFILVQPTSMVMNVFRQYAAAAGATLTARVQVTTFDAACRNVASGLGISIIPREIAQYHATALNLQLVDLTDSWATRRFGICVRSRDALSPSARLLVDFLVESDKQ